jgi:Amino-transferase class IV
MRRLSQCFLFACILTDCIWAYIATRQFLQTHVMKTFLTSSRWSEYAEFNRNNIESFRTCGELDGYNLDSPREWLEYQENIGNIGVYTVVRCDIASNLSTYHLWEEEFHWERLCRSMHSISNLGSVDQTYDDSIRKSKVLLRNLMNSYLSSLVSMEIEKFNSRCTCMFTVLWHMQPQGCGVKVHLCTMGFSDKNDKVYQQGITAILVKPDTSNQPNRHKYLPLSKLSSWCRVRRPIESRLKLKPGEEAFLTRMADESNMEILEGLTSNIFVICQNGTFRTPADGILEGCARNQVLRLAKSLGYKVETAPILFHDFQDWQEVFCTSAIRLLVPVKVILTESRSVVWESKASTSNWLELYTNLPNNSLISTYDA